MSIPTKRLDSLDPTINPERDHEVAAMRDGISNKLRVEQILALLQSSDIPDNAVTLAKLSAGARAAGNHTYDNASSGLAAETPQAAIDELKGLIDAEPEIIQSDTRQTVNTGPVNDGRADFLAAGTGLEVVTTGLTATPLNLTMGDGFSPRGKRDLSFVVDENVPSGALPDDTTSYLYFEYDEGAGTLSFGHSTLAPDYSRAKPGSPATGQYWYPTDHRSRGEVWDGAEWVPVYRIYVGECATSGGSVASVTSYAYQGSFTSSDQLSTGSTSISLGHNIGVAPDLIDHWFTARITASAPTGFSVGDVVRLQNHLSLGTGASTTRRHAAKVSRNSMALHKDSNFGNIFQLQPPGGSITDHSFNNAAVRGHARRSF